MEQCKVVYKEIKTEINCNIMKEIWSRMRKHEVRVQTKIGNLLLHNHERLLFKGKQIEKFHEMWF